MRNPARGLTPGGFIRRRLIAGALILGGLALNPTAVRAQGLPVFDAHIHYSAPDWSTYTPDTVLGILARAGVRRAIVSSTPDDGTLKLYEKAPAVVVPFLRPYRTRDDMGTWTREPAVASYVEGRLARGIYRGIGEFHLGAAEADGPTVKRLAQLAAERNIFLWAHVDDAAVERLLALYPANRILWAHAGMSAPAETVGRLLDRHPKLWVELSLRSGDIAPGGKLSPAWRAVFVRHPGRFLVGTDTWTTSRWEAVANSTQAVQDWLGQLPREVAEKIAHGNGDALFPAR